MRERRRSVGSIAAALALAAACGRGDGNDPKTNDGNASALRGPRIVQDMIRAHGGLEPWRAAATVSFEDAWGGEGDKPVQVSRVVVEQSSRRAYLDIPDAAARIAWDGDRAWSTNWPSATPPRFLALLSYYFLNLPWLTQDPGVRLGEPGTGRLPGDDTEYTTVLMTFEPGVGDTPDDYYRLYIDPATNLLRGCAYIVTYSALMPEGMKSTPEHVLVYDEVTTVAGLRVPVRLTIYEGDVVYAKCTIRDWAFDRVFDESRMIMTPGDVLDPSKP
jgi:hypothetical protein